MYKTKIVQRNYYYHILSTRFKRNSLFMFGGYEVDDLV